MATGIWDVILAEAATNLVLNPCATITGNLVAIGATAGTAVSRVTTYSYFGPACHRITSSTDTEGGYFVLKAAANAIHYATMRINSASDIDAFDVSMDNANWHAVTLLATEGSWWVYGVQIPAAEANASTAFRIHQRGAGSIDLYIGHVQVEQNTYPTTPVTGDLVGFIRRVRLGGHATRQRLHTQRTGTQRGQAGRPVRDVFRACALGGRHRHAAHPALHPAAGAAARGKVYGGESPAAGDGSGRRDGHKLDACRGAFGAQEPD